MGHTVDAASVEERMNTKSNLTFDFTTSSHPLSCGTTSMAGSK